MTICTHCTTGGVVEMTLMYADGVQEESCRECATIAPSVSTQADADAGEAIRYVIETRTGSGVEYATTGPVRIVREWIGDERQAFLVTQISSDNSPERKQ